jgi:hypothetical protein
MSRLLNKLIDSNQAKRFHLIDEMCVEKTEYGIEELRSFISIMYLGNPPRRSMFNLDGTPKPKKDVCTFLKRNGGKIVNLFTHQLKVVGKSFLTSQIALMAFANTDHCHANILQRKAKLAGTPVSDKIKKRNEKNNTEFWASWNLHTWAIMGFLAVYSNARTALGIYRGENRKALAKNVGFIIELENQVGKASDKSHIKSDMNLKEQRQSIMRLSTFTVYMLLDGTGKLRNEADMRKAKSIMTRKKVRENILRYNNTGSWLGKYAHNRKTTAEKNAVNDQKHKRMRRTSDLR